MKIGIFVGSYYPDIMRGGSELQCYLIARELTRLGHFVYFFALDSIEQIPMIEKVDNLIVYRLIKNRNFLSKFMTIYGILKKEKIEICYIRYFKCLTFIAIECKLLNIPFVYNVYNIAYVVKLKELKKSYNKKTNIIKYLKDLCLILFNYWGMKQSSAIVCPT